MTESHKISDVFTYNGKIYVLHSDPFESRENFIKRGWYIVKYMDDNKLSADKLSEVEVLSRMWLNGQTIKAKYS